MNKFAKIAAVPVLLVVIAVILFFSIKITSVTVSGGEIYEARQIESCAMSDKYAYQSVYFWIMTHFKNVECLPFTQEVDVKWNNMHSITLQVYDKKISGCVSYMGKYVYFDKDGVVLQSLSEHMDGVPIVTGVKFGKFTINEAIDVKDESTFETIMNLSQLISHYEVIVDKIQFDDKKVTLCSGNVKVFLGQKDFYDDDLAALSSVLKKTQKKKLSGTINMEHFKTGDNIVLKTTKKVKEQ